MWAEVLERRTLLAADPTSISIAVSQFQAVYGQPLTLTATVVASPKAPSEGTVTFSDNGTVLGTATVDAGTAKLSKVGLSVGTYQITASYDDASGTFAPSSTVAQATSQIKTVAGDGVGDNLPASLSDLQSSAVAVDAAGDVFIADGLDNRIREVNHTTGIITTVAGNGVHGFSGDGGPATSAKLNDPEGVAVDASGDLFIADTENYRIREVNHATGVISTIAGDGAGNTTLGDGGPATSAFLSLPQGLAVSSADLFIADRYDNRVREVDLSTGVITTFAGGSSGGDGGASSSAALSQPTSVALDTSGDLFIADYGDNRIREVNHATGIISTVAGGGSGGDGGLATSASLNGPEGVAVDTSGDLIIGDTNNYVVRKVDHATGIISRVAGNGSEFYQYGGMASPEGLAVDGSGNVFIADYGDGLVLKLNHASGALTPFAGDAPTSFSGGNGPATAAYIGSPTSVAVDASGDLFIAETSGRGYDNRILEVNHLTGTVTTVAGDGTRGFSGDGGQATLAEFASPTGVAVDSSGDLFIADSGNNRIREVDLSTGIITTIAGSGVAGFAGDGGPATSAELSYPTGVAVDNADNLFISDTYNGRVREVSQANDSISTIAQVPGYSAWPAPDGIAVDGSDNVYIADQESNEIYEVNHASGNTAVVAGGGIGGGNDGEGDGGPATSAALSRPYGVAVDAAGDLFIADSFDSQIREVDHATGLISNLAGGNGRSFGGDGGVASAAALYIPDDVAVDASGNLFIADTDNGVIREVANGVSVTITPAPLTITADNESKVYGADVSALTVTYSGLVNNDTAASLTTQPTLSTTATEQSHVSGTPYPITVGGASDPNYTITYRPGTLTVTPAPLTITADHATKVYGAPLPTLAASYSGFVNGDTAAVISTPPVLSTTATAASHVAASPFSITASDAAADSDYTIVYVNGSLTVTPAPLTVTADDASKAYGAALPTLTVSYSGFVNGDIAASLTTPPTLATAATVQSHVSGSPYTVTASGAVDPDYTFTYMPGSLTVTPVPLTITAEDQTKVYGAAVPTLTASYSGFVNGDTAASLTTQPKLATTATAQSHVAGNPYSITVSGASDPDYTMSYAAGNLTVTPATLTITADDKTKVYGAGLPTLTASSSGFVNGDTAAVISTPPVLATTATAASHVSASRYAITASGAAADSDYRIVYVNGSLTVTPAPLVVTADDESKAYGAALPTLTASYSGFVNGDTAASLVTPPTLSTVATAQSHVSGSPYTITASGAADPDYTFTYKPGSLTVTPVPLTISAEDKSKVYGAPLPTLAASYSGFVNGDTAASLTTPPALSTTATPASHVSGNPYTITATGAVDADYTISYVSGTLTVTPAPLTITADNQTKLYGAAPPALTASYSGFLNGDASASLTTPPGLATAATSASAIGTYPITVAGAASSDYTISYVPGTLTVTAAPLDYTSAGGNVTVDMANGDVQILSGSTVAASVPLADVASVTITGADGVANSFTLDYSGGTFVIPGGITFEGGALPATPSNSLSIVGGTFATDTFTFSSAHDGSVQLGTGGQVVNYTNMTPLANSGTASNVVFNLPNGAVDASLAPAAGGTVELSSSNGAFETTTFPSPSKSLDVNAGSGSDTVTASSNFYNAVPAQLTVHGAANVLALDTQTAGTLLATEGASLTNTLATFTDPNGAGAQSMYSATVDWGDGSSATTASVSGPDANGVFTVTGTHTYVEQSATTETINVVIGRSGSARATVTDAVIVADGPLAVTGTTLVAHTTSPLTGTLATFTDPGGAQPLGDYSAAIDWGDGNGSAPGTISGPDANGVFTVVGSHTYTSTGTVTATVEILHTGVTMDAFANDTIDVSSVPVPVGSGASLTGTVGTAVSAATVATFTFGDGSQPASDFTATIDWGDGQRSAGTVSESGTTYSVVGTHTYTTDGTFKTKTTVTEEGNSTPLSGSAVIGLSAPEKYVSAVFEDVLGRGVDPSGLQYWTQQIAGGMPISGVANAIVHSAEYYAKMVIEPDYLKLLGRAADAAGVQFWTTQMQNGLSDQGLEADLVAADEFYNNAGGTDVKWIDTIYQLLLGRPADSSGESYWTGQLAAGETRSQVAIGIAGSTENNTQLINDDYFHYLGRAADAGGLAFWLQQFANGSTNEDVIAGFTGAAEYYDEHTK